MFYSLDGKFNVVSGDVHRAMNDLVSKMTRGKVSGWEGNYEILINCDGQIKASPTMQNGCNGFESGLQTKLVFLPTPEWVKGTTQTLYICFSYELGGMMGRWWKNFAERF